MGRGWKSLEVHARGNLEETIGRNDIKSEFDESSEKGEESSRGSAYHLREYIYHGYNVSGHI